MTTIRLRIKGANGMHTLQDIQQDMSIYSLKMKVSALVDVPVDRMTFKIGFPPKTCLVDGESTLVDAGIKNGEQIIVESTASTPIAPVAAVTLSDSDCVKTEDGYMVVREMKDDNSCLFRSIAYVLMRDVEQHKALRQVIANAIRNDQQGEYSQVVLGKKPEEYVQWIQKPDSWGGAIELAIFSAHFQVEICSIDAQTMRIDRFGQDQYKTRCFVMYSGIHYDAIAVSPDMNAPQEFDMTTFTISAESLDDKWNAAKRLASIWNTKHKYTDLANFTLRCGICKKGLRGQQEAQSHAKSSGHTSFTEYA